MAQVSPSVTIIVPAHDEEFALARLLTALLDGAGNEEFAIIVVCNGCTDNTVKIARSFEPRVAVVELAVASKPAALYTGGSLAQAFPIVFVDADVVIDAASVRRLAARLRDDAVLAAGPARHLDRHGVSAVAGWYYDIWERLPQVSTGLFGRGVIALSELGYRRVAGLPHVISDDLAVSESFLPEERDIVPGASVTIWPARRWRALLARRIRVTQGNRELAGTGLVSPSASTRPRDLWRIVRLTPSMALRMPVFLGTAALARLVERFRSPARGVWLRDETSRA
ncbi:glycosyltransferase [Cryobacterium arcticum]|uniref:4,4'-diaponeurosporenoate glycosyltransferase n=1 Tax=Cryobacterium arcticum TaxID=670052 RepID=A0A317ZR33_9MICO|nr:glycosyltransferase [Cryobacterium arcticum]PXA65719.1 glycosyl transferase [Cryobacterium arcticum]